MTGLALLAALLAPPTAVRWPQGQTLQVVRWLESDGRFNATRVASWERLEQRWQVGAPDAQGRIPVRVHSVAGHKVTEGQSAEGPIQRRVSLTGPPAADADGLGWQVVEQAPRRLWLSPDGQAVVAAAWVEGPAAVEARFRAAGGVPEALSMPLAKVLSERVSPVQLSRMLPKVGPDGWVEARAVPSLLNATLEQTLWHRRQDGPAGVVDAFDGTGTLTGSTALFWMVALTTNRVHGHTALDPVGRPLERVERLEAEGKVIRPPASRKPGEARYGPLRFDITMGIRWTPLP